MAAEPQPACGIEDELERERRENIRNLQSIVEEAFRQKWITKTQTPEGVVFTIRVPHVSSNNPTFDLFRLASGAAH